MDSSHKYTEGRIMTLDTASDGHEVLVLKSDLGDAFNKIANFGMNCFNEYEHDIKFSGEISSLCTTLNEIIAGLYKDDPKEWNNLYPLKQNG